MLIYFILPTSSDKSMARFRSKGNLPECPGVYMSKNRRKGTVTYIGESVNIRVRINKHRAQCRPFANLKTMEFYWKPMDNRSTSISRRKIEKALIKKHNPKYNQNAGGGGRIAGYRRRRSQ